MKVICINTDKDQVVPSGQYAPQMPDIKEGEVCTVIDQSEYEGLTFYRFAEYIEITNKFRWWYDARSFIPLSDKDEAEMEHNSLITIPKNKCHT